MSFESQWLENDYNPFIVFNSCGKIVSLNSEAQFLMGVASPSEIFELATNNANITFGFKTTFIELEFDRFKFFGITVGYLDEEQIGVKLYQLPSFKINKIKPIGELTNIFALVDLSISANSISSSTIYKKDFDPTIPEIIINANNFIKLLNKTYSCFETSQEITTKIYYRIGEHIIFEDKKYSIFSIDISGDTKNIKNIKELNDFVDKVEFNLNIQEHISIDIPMIFS